MKENFYVFLDIDGVLWNEEYIVFLRDNNIPKDNDIETYFSSKSMTALNTLLNSLENKFKVQLVITSSRRSLLEKTIAILYKNNLVYDDKIDKTESTIKNIDMPRGLEIKKYLKQNKNSKNYVVIDDEVKDIKPFIKHSHIIDVKNEGLQLHHIEKFLKAKDISLISLNENER